MTNEELIASINDTASTAIAGFGGSKAQKLDDRAAKKELKISGMTADDADSGEGWRLQGGDSPEVFHDIQATGNENNPRSKVYKQVAADNGISIQDAVDLVDSEALAYKSDLDYRNSREFQVDQLSSPNDPYYKSKNLAEYVVGQSADGSPITSYDVYNAGDAATEAARLDAESNPNSSLYVSEKFLTGKEGYFGRELSDNKEYVTRQIATGYMIPGANDPEEYKAQMELYQNAKEQGLGNFADPRTAHTMDTIFDTSYGKKVNDGPVFGAGPGNGYIENAAKAGAAGIAGGFYGVADVLSELAGAGVNAAFGEGTVNWDLGTEEERRKEVNSLIGYDDTRSAASMAIIGKEAKAMWDAGELDSAGLLTIAKTAFTDADTFMYSLGTLATWVVGGTVGAPAKLAKAVKLAKAARAAGDTAKAAKYIKTAKALRIKANSISAGTKAAGAFGNILAKDAGFNAAVMSATNDDIDAFKKNNGGEYSIGDVARMALVNYAGMGLDRFTDLHLLKSTPGAIDGLRQVAKAIGGNGIEVINKKIGAMGVAVASSTGSLVVSMGKEGAQEYVQTMAEIFNEQYNTEKYGDDASDILLSDKNIVEGFTAAGAGAGGGAQFHAIGTAKGIVVGAENHMGDQFDPERTEAFNSKSAQAHRDASLDDLAKVKDPVAQKFNADLVNEDLVATINDLDKVPEGSTFEEHVAETVSVATERTAAIYDIKSDSAKGIIAAGLVNRIIKSAKDVTPERKAEIVKSATAGLSESAKETVYDKIIATELSSINRQFRDSDSKAEAEAITAGDDETEFHKLNSEKLKAIKTKAESLKSMGSTFEDDGYIGRTADAIIKQVDSYTAENKTANDVNKEIFETGFSIQGQFGSTYNKSMVAHSADIQEDMVNGDSEDSTAIKSLQNFVSSRGANKISDTNSKGRTFNNAQQASLARSVYENNSKIGGTIDSLIGTARADGRDGYVAKLDGMKAELNQHNVDLLAKAESLGRPIKSNKSGSAQEQWVSSVADNLTSADDNSLRERLRGIDAADISGYSKQHKQRIKTARQYIISKIGSTPDNGINPVVDEPTVDVGNGEDVVITDGDSSVIVESTPAQIQSAKVDSWIDNLENSIDGTDDIEKLKKYVDSALKGAARKTWSEAQIARVAALGMKAYNKGSVDEELDGNSQVDVNDDFGSDDVVVEDTEVVANTEAPAKLIGVVNQAVLDVVDSSEIVDMQSEYDELTTAIDGMNVKDEKEFAEYKGLVADKKKLAAKIVDTRADLRAKSLKVETDRIQKHNADVLSGDSSLSMSPEFLKTLNRSVVAAKVVAAGMKADDVAAMKVEDNNVALELRLTRENMKDKPRADVVDKLTAQIEKNASKTGDRVNQRRARNKTVDARTKNAEEIGTSVEVTAEERAELRVVADAENIVRDTIEEVETLIDEAYKGQTKNRNEVKAAFRGKIKKIKDDIYDAKKARRKAIALARKSKDRGSVMAVLSSPKALVAVLIGAMKELHAEVKMLKAKLGAKYEEMKENLDALDVATATRIANLRKKLDGLYVEKAEANAARKEVVKSVIRKHTGFTDIEKGMKGNSLFAETIQASGGTDTNIFNRETSARGILGSINNVLNMGLLPTSMQRKIMAELDGIKAVGNSMLEKVLGDIKFADTWIAKGSGTMIAQDMIIKFGENPKLSKEDLALVKSAKLETIADNNGVKRIVLMKDGHEVVLPDGSEYAINPMMMITDYKDGNSKSGKAFSKKLREVVAMEGMQLVSDMLSVKYKAGAEMEQFIKGIFGVDQNSNSYQSLVGVLMSGNMPEAAFVQSAGKNVMKLLGIKADKDLNVDQANALVSALGQMVIEQVKGTTVDRFDANQNYMMKVDSKSGSVSIKASSGILVSGDMSDAAFIQRAGKVSMKLLGTRAGNDLNATITSLGEMAIRQIGKIHPGNHYLLKVDSASGTISAKISSDTSNGNLPVDAQYASRDGKEFRLLSFDIDDDAKKQLLSASGTMEYLGVGGHRNGAMLEPGGHHVVGEMLIRGTSTLADEKDVEYVNVQEQIPRTFNETFKVLEKVLGDKAEDWYDALLQPYEEIAKLPARGSDGANSREIALVNRKAGEFEIDGILETRAFAGDENWYLEWDMTSSDRYMIDSNVINPQNGKISRFLVGMQGMRSTMKWGKGGFAQEDIDLFHAAASQALGYGIDKNPDANVIAELNEEHFKLGRDGGLVFADTEHGNELKDWVQAVKDGKVPDMRSEDPKERMHALQLVVALSKVESGKDLEHELVIEMDGVTNGMIMTLLQIGTDEAMALLEKGGVYYHSQFQGGSNENSGSISDEELDVMIGKLPAGLKKKFIAVMKKLDECKG